MKLFALKRSLFSASIIISPNTNNGLSSLSHYSEEEVQQYISKNYPNLTYQLESQRITTWQVTFDKYPKCQLKYLKSCTPLHLLYHKLIEY